MNPAMNTIPEPTTADSVFHWFATTRCELTPTVPSVVDEIELFFDWIPSVTNGSITFITTIVRGAARSTIQYEVDLNRLSSEELEQLHDVLCKRHAGTDNGPEVAKAIGWLLDLSLAQSSRLDLHARRLAVGQLLLVS
jgi:hypothetical protein